MTGWIDGGGRALVRIALKTTEDSSPTVLEAWIDTGFTGELVLPANTISGLKLRQSGTLGAELGDGSTAMMKTYTCLIDWFGDEQEIQIVANNGRRPLLGIGLLRERKLTIDYPEQTVSIE